VPITYRFFILLLSAAVISCSAQTFSVLANFNGTNGTTPNGVIQGTDGNFYGTTQEGGANGAGTVFKFSPGGGIAVLYSFARSLTNGAQPLRLLVQASDGNFYGVTTLGGSSTSCASMYGCGTVFKVTPSGTLTTLYSFNGTDGYNPEWLIKGSDGNLYGTTTAMTAPPCSSSCGTVFKLTLGGTLSTLHTFNGADGYGPTGLMQASDGNFYGVTGSGGAGASCKTGCGTVFKLTPGGTMTTLYSFGMAGFTDGWTPISVVQGSDGALYGTTANGGDVTQEGTGVGTVFRITTGGSLTTLYNFTVAGGAFPSWLTAAGDGNLYGTTSLGGTTTTTAFPGMLFRITTAGALTVLHTFNPDQSEGGGGILAPMFQGSDGGVYGTSFGGGANGDGTVFRLALGTGSTPSSPSITASAGIINGASLQAGIVPNSWITIKGTNLSTVTDTWANAIVNGNLPTSLDGVSVSVGAQAAYIYYVSPTQINAIAPNVGPGTLQVTVTSGGVTSAPVTATSQAVQPAFFQWGTYAVATNLNYGLAVKNGTFPTITTTPAKPGDVIVLWGTGFGPTSPAAPIGVQVPSTGTYNTAMPVTVTVGGVNATVYGAALTPGLAALYQVAVQIPASLANGDYPVIATINGVSTPSTTLITVQQ
jgi:uncharacterized protein (TIGR03437 family)